MIATSMLPGMKPTHSRQKFLLGRVDGLNLRVQSLTSTPIDGVDPLLMSEVETSLQPWQTVKIRGHQPHQSSDNDRHYPRLVEDVLLLIVEEISPRMNLGDFTASNDITTLRSMRL
jgi:hypothetical protein